MVTLILADDHPVFSAGLRAVFDAEDDFEVLAVVGTGRAAVEAAVAHRPEVAVLDIAFAAEGDQVNISLEDLKAAAETLKEETGLNLLPTLTRLAQAKTCTNNTLTL